MGQEEVDRSCLMDMSSSLPRSEMTSTTDENEEFFDFAEGDNSQIMDTISSNGVCDHEPLTPVPASVKSPFDQWLEESDAMLDDLSIDKQLIYNKLKAGKDRFGPSAEVLWRLTKALRLLGTAAQKKGDKDKQKDLAFETLRVAKEALNAGPENADCHKWYAVAVGSISDFVTTKEKIQNGGEFKLHVDRALALRQGDATLYHMRGRWAFEVASLTWIERKVASTLFSKVPEASVEDAVDFLLKAHVINSNWKENVLCVAKCYIALKRFQEAIEWIDRGIELETRGEDDQMAHSELLSLQTKYSKYRS
jgi:tetratricopeptide (TPR) repeat protein